MSNQQTSECFICNKKVTAHIHAETSITEYKCNYCSRYYLSELLRVEIAWIRPIMFYCLLHNTSGKRIFFVANKPSDEAEYKDAHFITKEILEGMKPKNINEKIDMIMMNLSKKIKILGDSYRFIIGGIQAQVVATKIQSGLILFCNNIVEDYNKQNEPIKELYGTLKLLVDYGYLERKNNSNHEYSFSVAGWKYVGELQSSKNELPQAFIAMWFSPEMVNARESIKKAIIDSGYTYIIIDEKEHNKQIVPEIFYEIQRSKFLIADLTGHRNGVYYEAGYAQGLGKEVIFTCSEKGFRKRHFDVAQVSTVVWKDEDDLYKRLLKRIEATVGKRIGI